VEEAHAVQVVGYDNNLQAWLIKNSWGPKFAADGFAWVAFEAPGMCDLTDTYGFAFIPSQPQPTAQLAIAPAPGRKGCWVYQALVGDYPYAIASRVGMSVAQLLLDNLDVIKDPSTVAAGTRLLLCTDALYGEEEILGGRAAGGGQRPRGGGGGGGGPG
jgi:hypothetical protein